MGRRRGARVGLLVVVLVVAACGSDRSEGAAGTTTTTGVASTAPPEKSCLWSEAVTAEANNTQHPDSGAAYWFSGYTLPEGATPAHRHRGVAVDRRGDLRGPRGAG